MEKGMRNRRKLIVALGAGALAAPFGSFAQRDKVWRVGFLSARSRPDFLDSDMYGVFPQRMRELGYVEGKNLVIEWRFADGKSERFQHLAEELAQIKVDAIVAASTPPASLHRKQPLRFPSSWGASPIRSLAAS
jgi:putative ABC transport system substrate-binding protein